MQSERLLKELESPFLVPPRSRRARRGRSRRTRGSMLRPHAFAISSVSAKRAAAASSRPRATSTCPRLLRRVAVSSLFPMARSRSERLTHRTISLPCSLALVIEPPEARKAAAFDLPEISRLRERERRAEKAVGGLDAVRRVEALGTRDMTETASRPAREDARREGVESACADSRAPASVLARDEGTAREPCRTRRPRAYPLPCPAAENALRK